MIVYEDLWATRIRLTGERREHILGHPEMAGMEEEIPRTLLSPGEVVRSGSDPDVRLYYRCYQRTLVGAKYLCVVVKVRAGAADAQTAEQDAFIITAYLTDKIKRGEPLWTAERHPGEM